MSRGKRKAQPFRLSLFSFSTLSSGYQVERRNRPKFFEGIVVEALWNVREHFGTGGEKLDKISTFGGFKKCSSRCAILLGWVARGGS
jgi:hypothetical protein